MSLTRDKARDGRSGVREMSGQRQDRGLHSIVKPEILDKGGRHGLVMRLRVSRHGCRSRGGRASYSIPGVLVGSLIALRNHDAHEVRRQLTQGIQHHGLLAKFRLFLSRQTKTPLPREDVASFGR